VNYPLEGFILLGTLGDDTREKPFQISPSGLKKPSMRRLVLRARLPILLMIALRLCAQSPPPSPLTTIETVRALSPADAARGLPVRVEGVVTYNNLAERNLFLQDAHSWIYVQPDKVYTIPPGSRVEVVGRTSPSYTNQIESSSIRVLGRAPLPTPALLDYDQAVQRQNDCRYVSMEGVVRAASFQTIRESSAYLLQLETEGRVVDAAVTDFPDFHPDRLLDATVRVTGVLGGSFDATNDRIIGLRINVTSGSDVTILHPAGPAEARPLSLPELLSSNESLRPQHRVFTSGTVTLYDPGEMLAIQEGSASLLVRTRQMDKVSIGQRVEVTGFMSVMDGSAGLAQGQFSVLPGGTPVVARDISFADALSGLYSDRLVRIEGQVVSQTRENHLDSLFLRSGDRVFQALFRKPTGDPDPIPAYPVGTRIRVTGVCTVHIRGFWGAVESFQIHLRSPGDITVVAPASWWTLGHLFLVTSALFALAVVALAWGLRMRRRVLRHEQLLRQKSEVEATRLSTLARLERQRSHILELINSFQPLPIVLTAIQAYANEMWPGTLGYSHMLADRKLVLMCRSHLPTETAARLEIVDPSSSPEPCAEAVRSRRLTGPAEDHNAWSSPIFSSRGEILGTMTFEGTAASPLTLHPQAFDFGCNLAAIAIDNRRLYEDVLHRSEHDQLTGLPNRSLVESRLAQALQKAGTGERFIAVLYLDLDDFKAVNDTYTHRIGDCFLIEVSRRFQACLRNCDTLGRIGGDEFLAVLADLADPSLAQTIAERLVRTMEAPFTIEGHSIRGSVSIGVAVHPGLSGTPGEITQHADHAMYVAKRAGGNQVSHADSSLIAP